jgi:2-oxoglutarate ferredoxin oxidoreductase subunit delta
VRYWRERLDRDRFAVPHGRVVIVTDRCKGCAFCVEYCPRDVLAMSPGFNRKGYHPPEVIRADDCVDCGLCEMICPEFAIFPVPGAAHASAEGRPP